MKIFKNLFSKGAAEPRHAFPEDMVGEAKANPGGWVYEISSRCDPNGAIPPHAIKGAWRVDDRGEIVPGSYTPNPNFRSEA